MARREVRSAHRKNSVEFFALGNVDARAADQDPGAADRERRKQQAQHIQRMVGGAFKGSEKPVARQERIFAMAKPAKPREDPNKHLTGRVCAHRPGAAHDPVSHTAALAGAARHKINPRLNAPTSDRILHLAVPKVQTSDGGWGEAPPPMPVKKVSTARAIDIGKRLHVQGKRKPQSPPGPGKAQRDSNRGAAFAHAPRVAGWRVPAAVPCARARVRACLPAL
jgi:hypothetical protein